MLVLSEYALKQLMTAVVNATHGITDTAGTKYVGSTINEPQLRMAALSAVQLAVGEVVWGGDRKLTIERRKQTDDIFVEV